MKVLITVICLLIFFGVSYSIYSKYQMHTKLENYIAHDQSIRNVIGVYENSDIISSGSDCKYGGDCELTFLQLNIRGALGCVRASVTLHEFLPTYRVLSISPQNYFERKPLQKIVHGFEGTRAQRCKSA